jgi:pyruvate dehydrogenase E1 component alpha subunit
MLVDGNDILAVHEAMRQAVERARDGQGPTLIETLTYRIGAHTTADDPTRYREASEVESWRAKDPITRFQRFLTQRNLLTPEQDDRIVEETVDEVNRAASEAEEMPAPAPDGFFEHAEADLTPRLQAQRAELLRYAGQRKQGRG